MRTNIPRRRYFIVIESPDTKKLEIYLLSNARAVLKTNCSASHKFDSPRHSNFILRHGMRPLIEGDIRMIRCHCICSCRVKIFAVVVEI